MDRYQQLSYEKDFRISFLESKGDPFQKFFETLMNKVYPNDFMACRPWGSVGDRKNDGYLPSKKILFQVYAPNDISANKAILKIDEDFEGAKNHWEQYFNEWVFVHNTHDGRLSPDIIKKLLDIQSHNPEIKISHWGYEELLIEFRKLDIEALESWFGTTIDMQTSAKLGFDQLQAILQHIQLTPYIDKQDILEVSQRKIETNQLSPAVSDFLKIGMQKYNLVKSFFISWRDPNYEGQLASAFEKKYTELKNFNPALHPDLIFANLEEWAGGTISLEPAKKAAVLAILAYFFDKCVIFEDAKTKK